MAMEIVRREEQCFNVQSKGRSTRYAKISLEEYLHFLDSRNYSDFSINYLNQIIAMHGYKKIHKTPKKVLTEAMRAINLVNPCRSTLNDKISPSDSAAATLESVVKDLNELGWQECTITSVEAISSETKSLAITAAAPPGPKKRRARALKDMDKAKAKSKRVALKPVGNAIVSGSFEGKSKRAVKKKKKKLCDCKGCASLGDF